MSNNTTSSPLQMHDWRIADFSAQNSIIDPSPDIVHKWKIKAHINQLDPTDDSLSAVVFVEFLFLAEQDNKQIRFEGLATSYYSFNKSKADVDDPQALFDKLLHGSVMTNMFGNLRVFLLQAGTLFQTGAKRVILPFINLHDFHFDEEYSFVV